MTFDHAAFIDANTKLAPVPLRPDIALHLTDDTAGLWQKTQDALRAKNLPLPFWASAWAGGQALARYIFDHPALVAGKRVLDFASGSGLVAIAAMKAGAAHVEANDIDPFAIAAIALNGAANHASLIAALPDDIVGIQSRWDIIFAGDIAYERETTERVTQWLENIAQHQTQVFIGDPGRAYLPRNKLNSLARYDVPVSRNLEDCEIKAADVWEFKSVR